MHPDCPDFDLCEACESKPFSAHPDTHPLLKTRVPLRIDAQVTLEAADVVQSGHTARSFGNGHHGGRSHRHEHHRHRRESAKATCPVTLVEQVVKSEPEPQPAMEELRVPGGYVTKSLYDQDHEFKGQAPLIPDNKVKEMAPVQEVEQVIEQIQELDIKESNEETRTIASEAETKVDVAETKPETPEPEAKPVFSRQPVTPLDVFSWVRHQTMPPGCTLPVGAEFTKTWKLKHFASGSEYNFDSVRLVLKSDGNLGPACRDVDVSYKRDDVKDDEEVEVSIHGLRVPDTPGEEMVEHWRFEDENGVAYGQPLRLR